MKRKRVVVLGATGSIGDSTLKVANDIPERMEIVGLAANSNAEKLAAAANITRPKAICLVDERKIDLLRTRLKYEPTIYAAQDGRASEVRRIILTASGGPFREPPADRLGDVTVEEALKHPTWNMGPKITIDSATLFNKGLEMIEAHWLFGVEMKRVEVVIHP